MYLHRKRGSTAFRCFASLRRLSGMNTAIPELRFTFYASDFQGPADFWHLLRLLPAVIRGKISHLYASSRFIYRQESHHPIGRLVAGRITPASERLAARVQLSPSCHLSRVHRSAFSTTPRASRRSDIRRLLPHKDSTCSAGRRPPSPIFQHDGHSTRPPSFTHNWSRPSAPFVSTI